MKFAKIEEGVVTQINVRPTEGFVEVPEETICGQIQDGARFINPDPDHDPIKLKLQAVYEAAESVFNGLSKGKKALWKPVREEIAEAILVGDMTTAKEILETVPALYPDAEADRAAFLSLFP